MLAPIDQLLFRNYSSSLKLTEDQIAISYKTYKLNNADDRQEIVDERLTPG